MNPATIEAYTQPAIPYPAGLFDPKAQFDDEPDIFDLPVDDEPPRVEAQHETEEVDEPVVAGGSVSLRHYQQAAVNGVLKQFKGDKANGVDPVNSTIVVSATGTGKSVVIADLVRRNNNWGHGTLLLVHREELIKQLRGAIARVGVHVLKEKANERAIASFMSSQGTLMEDEEPFRTVVASVQTLRGDRLKQWPRDSFKLIITDECFPAGTLVDGRAIENIRVGDFVNSYNHTTGTIEKRRVARLFKNPAKQLIRVRLSNGKSFVCTPEHPIAVQTKKGVEYLPAMITECYTVMHEQNIHQAERMRRMRDDLSATQLELLHGPVLLGRVQRDCEESQDEKGRFPLCRMRRKCHAGRSGAAAGFAVWSRLLLTAMQKDLFNTPEFGNNGGDQSQVRIGAHEEKQSDVQSRSQSEAIRNFACDGMEAARAWWQRRNNSATENVSRCVRLAGGSGYFNRTQAGREISIADGLQSGYRQRGIEDSNRGRWQLSQNTEGQGCRQNKRRISCEIRVDSVEVLEPRSDGRFGEVCPDGFVYNIEVEWNHNYFVDGFLVHNCHHAPSPSYRAVYDHFQVGSGGARHVGFTATADRLDGKGLGGIFDSLAFEYNIRDAIHDPLGPFLVPIEAFPIETDPVIDLKALRVTAGDFNAGDLERAINDNIGVLVNAIVDNKALGDRRTIAFTPDVSSAQALALALQDVGITANWVAGNSPNRQEVLNAHRAGEFQVLVNCMILTEGYDDPEVSCILICRPTKSRSLYSQMVGRGTRLHPESGKMNCRVVDFAYMTGTHKLVSPVDLYDNSNTDDSVVERARELVESGQERDIDAALEKAQEEFEDGERVRIQRRIVQSRAKSFDLVGSFELLGIKQKADYNWNDVKPATPKMIQYARKIGVDLADDAGFGSTKKVLDAVSVRRKYGLSTMKQVATCIRLGAEPKAARKMSFEEAGAYISAKKTW